jgi:hypothetical protein
VVEAVVVVEAAAVAAVTAEWAAVAVMAAEVLAGWAWLVALREDQAQAR